MGDKNHSKAAASEQTRTRWTPKPEQILLLETIFNSGMVNPPKDEIFKIKKFLEKFGAVTDANVFYWFQNRRSRTRRRQRQLQQSKNTKAESSTSGQAMSGAILHDKTFVGTSSTPISCDHSSTSDLGVSGEGGGFDDLFAISRQMQSSIASTGLKLPCKLPGSITVIINGIEAEVPRGPIDMGASFGNHLMIVHSSGEILPVDEYGILLQGLQIGESYFLVRKPS